MFSRSNSNKTPQKKKKDEPPPPPNVNHLMIAPPPPEVLPIGWTAVVDPMHGMEFYHHSESNRSQWERPTDEENLKWLTEQWELSLTLQPAQFDEKSFATDTGTGSLSSNSDSQPTGQEREQSVVKGQHSPVIPPLNLSGKESSSPVMPWMKNSAEKKTAAVDVAVRKGVEVSLPDGTRLELPLGWIPLKDPTSGKTYYVETSTGASRWNPPYLFSADEAEAMRIRAVKYSVIATCPADYGGFTPNQVSLISELEGPCRLLSTKKDFWLTDGESELLEDVRCVIRRIFKVPSSLLFILSRFSSPLSLLI